MTRSAVLARWAIVWAFALVASACAAGDPPSAEGPWRVPAGFPEPEQPADNALTPERFALGKRLFYEPALSVDSSVSCASCHRPEKAFADDRAISPGVEGRLGARNAPSLVNLAWQSDFMREGGVASLEQQVSVPVEEHAEMAFSIVLAAERLAADPSYAAAARTAYDRPMDPWVLSRALAAFQRSLFSGASAWDAWWREDRPLSAGAEAGRVLFFGRAGCADCHRGFRLGGEGFANNGLYADYADPGRERLTGLETDRGVFRVPSLRNVGVTAPYMHDGSLPDLDAVVDHYAAGGAGPPNQDPRVRPLDLAPDERAALVAFLEALTDPDLLTDPLYRP